MTGHDAFRATRRPFVALALAAFALAVGCTPDPIVAAQALPTARPQQLEAARLRNSVEVRSSVDRTAIWIGDRFAFTVDIRCSNGTDILTDDLSRDRLKIDELELLGVEQSREDRGEGVTTYRFTYRLTTYSLEPPTKRIGEFPVRFYVRRPGQRPEDIAPAGDVFVPGATVVVRSLLPDDRDMASFRSERAPSPRAAIFGLLQALGTGLVVVSIVPAVLWLLALVRRVRQRRPRESPRHLRHGERTLLDEVRALDVETEAGRRKVFDHLSALVRRHVSGAWGLSADGLTPAEITAALSARGKGEVSSLAISLLDACEKARYGRSEDLPPPSACRAAIDQAEQLVGLGRA
ncbi:MAG: hypothetical protein AB1806_19740 [Acidobacteriota bacterium]